jgi:hypothetical protein
MPAIVVLFAGMARSYNGNNQWEQSGDGPQYVGWVSRFIALTNDLAFVFDGLVRWLCKVTQHGRNKADCWVTLR